MSRRKGALACLPCKSAGRRPIYGSGEVEIVFNPRMVMPGPPTISNHRLGAEFMAERFYALGMESEREDYMLTREEVLVACWWAGTYGPHKFRKVWGEWAKIAGHHLWYSCIRIDYPPTLAEWENPAPSALSLAQEEPHA